MVSQKQLTANRQNALKSTGPKTSKGKSKSSRNATRHGLLSKQMVLSIESKREFNGFRKRMLESLRPEGEMELLLADLVVASAWRLRRVMNVRRATLESIIEDHRLNIKKKEWVYICTKEFGFDPRFHMTDAQKESANAIWQQIFVSKMIGLGPVLKEDIRNNTSEIHRYEREYLSDMYKALRELHRVQACRRGLPVLPPLAVDVAISGGEARNN